MNGDAKNIFITGIVGRAMGSGSFGATDVKVLTLAAKEAWDEVVSTPAPPPPARSGVAISEAAAAIADALTSTKSIEDLYSVFKRNENEMSQMPKHEADYLDSVAKKHRAELNA